ncbi:MAG TPA: F0F1 ATP synthase subunit B [Bacteroidia bacterium]|nr:F0F1 ATP synthase subunit B [Bacteroidia bacterium]
MFIWALIIFLILVMLLKKFAWKPILGALKAREEGIQSSIDEAKQIRSEMANLKAENETLLAQARAEREAMLKEARTMGEEIVAKSHRDAEAEYKRMVEKALEDIRSEKMRALTDVKNQVAKLSIEVAEKILRQELSSTKTQEDVVNRFVNDMNLN